MVEDVLDVGGVPVSLVRSSPLVWYTASSSDTVPSDDFGEGQGDCIVAGHAVLEFTQHPFVTC